MTNKTKYLYMKRSSGAMSSVEVSAASLTFESYPLIRKYSAPIKNWNSTDALSQFAGFEPKGKGSETASATRYTPEFKQKGMLNFKFVGLVDLSLSDTEEEDGSEA